MSVLTAISGASSLLLLLIPPKTHETISPASLFCCPSFNNPGTSFCTDRASNTSYLAHLATNNSQLVCSDGLNVLSISHVSLHQNTSQFLSGRCMELRCEGEVESLDPSWETNLIFYIILRAAIDVLRASSIMMFEGAVVIIYNFLLSLSVEDGHLPWFSAQSIINNSYLCHTFSTLVRRSSGHNHNHSTV